MRKKGLLIVVSGPAGVGKGTICKAYIKRYDDVFLSRSSTTRQPRTGETNGVEYDFISKQEFESMIEHDELIEYVNVFDNYYGTPKKWVDEQINKGNDVILEIEIVGAMNVKKVYDDALLIFIMPPSSEILEQRLRGRNSDSDDQIKKRLDRMKKEVQKMTDYDFFVINDTVKDSVKQIRRIIRSQRCSVERYGAEYLEKYLKSMENKEN
ncbi:guanylate kinase [Criibacterium bergeronii]|uniref:Guanylate kinase n=1 Tax=Criibacterium bergeronii TaxID=1871336 RepID=A0A371INP4_9FIRM|nr:guanylate kinase [Criibacterium bergeronii]RDY22099.1 guanylate kinase [Criibacterium bergeronii]TRW27944.1 guanylate kinase [Criibacterium bergeronii]